MPRDYCAFYHGVLQQDLSHFWAGFVFQGEYR